MAQINYIQFTPGTTIKSADANSNNTTTQTFLNSLRPTLYAPITGILVTGTNVFNEIVISQPYSFVSVNLRVKTAPTGADLIIDINKNGSSIFSTRPTISAGSTTGGSSAVFNTVSVTTGDVITIDVDQIGSTVPGSNLVVALVFTI